MGAAIPLPRELHDFLKLPGPQSLLIRGPPGSGKTTLSLALLESFNGARYFISNRVPGDDVLLAFPWLGENGSRGIKVVDNSHTDATIVQSARFLMNQAATALLEDPAESTQLQEFLWLPEPLQETWSLMDGRKPALVIVDSWDALVEAYIGGAEEKDREKVPTRGEIERALLNRMGSAKAHVVFVLERQEQTQLDYLVNGVAVTSREVRNDRLERWLTIYKLRGVRIENAFYPFSLESARFECILPVRPYGFLRGGRFDPAPDPMPGYLWPGSKAFADSFGRLPLGRSTLVELDREVPSRIPYVLLAPMIAQTIDQGGRVVMIPDGSAVPEDVWESLHGAVQKKRFLEQVRFLLPPLAPGEKGAEFEPTVARYQAPDRRGGGSPEDTALNTFLRRSSTPDSPGLLVVFLQGLGSLATSVGVPITAETAQRMPASVQSAVRGAPLHAVLLGSGDSPLFDPLRPTAALRIEVGVRLGRVFLHGSDPWTPSFVLTEGHESSPYGLLRVV